MADQYGATAYRITRFGGGYVPDLDPTEIDDDQAANLRNVNVRSLGIDTRLGRAVLNATAPTANPVHGAGVMYSRDGTAHTLLLQAGGAIYEATGTSFSAASGSGASGLTGGVPFDFMPYRDRVYGGNRVDGVRVRNNAGDWNAAALITPPVLPTLTAYTPVLEAFDTDTTHASDITSGWVTDSPGGGTIALVATTDDKLEGAASLQFTFQSSTKGGWAAKKWSFGPTVDLSSAESLAVSYQANKAGITLAFGILPNDYGTTISANITNGSVTSMTVSSNANLELGDLLRIDAEIIRVTSISGTTIGIARGAEGTTGASHTSGASVLPWATWSKFIEVKTADTDAWATFEIPLAKIPPELRTRSRGLVVKLLNPGKSGFNSVFQLDRMVARGPLEADTYQYHATYVTSTSINDVAIDEDQSNRSPAAELVIEDATPILGTYLTVPASGSSAVNEIWLYRYRSNGHFSDFWRVGTMPNAATQLNGAIASATATTCVVDSTLGISPGCVLTIESERCLVTAVTASTETLTIIRGWDGTTAATHADNTAVTTSAFFDAISDGDLALGIPIILPEDRIPPPKAGTYALWNDRMVAADCSIDSADFPWRLYLSRLGHMVEFSEAPDPADPLAAGALNIPSRDHIVRLLELDGALLIFCRRSIWQLTGSGWSADPGFGFSLQQRANVGLDAREAVAVFGQLVFFLSTDGVRLLTPGSRGYQESLDSWPVSEPVASILKAIPATYRKNAAMALDEDGRLLMAFTGAGETVNRYALVFDPQLPGASLERDYNPKRRGWSLDWPRPASRFVKLDRGGGDAGQLLAADPSVARLWYLHRNGSDAEILNDGTSTIAEDLDDSETTVTVADGTRFVSGQVLQVDSERMLITGISGNDLTVTRGYASSTAATHSNGATITALIEWFWQTKALDAGDGKLWEWVYLEAQFDAAASEKVTFTPVLDGADGTASVITLSSTSSGFVTAHTRTSASTRGRFGGLRVSGYQGVGMHLRALSLGLLKR